MAQEHKWVTATRLVVGSLSLLEEMKYLFKNVYFHFFALVLRQSAVLSSATPHAIQLQNSAQNG